MKKMSPKLFLLFNHQLTREQILDAKKNLSIEEFIYIPNDLQKIWSNFDPAIESFKEELDIFVKFLNKNAKKDDFILVQGDFGAVYSIVDFCFKNGFVPIYATTKRISKERNLGFKTEKISLFEHIAYRKYEQLFNKAKM